MEEEYNKNSTYYKKGVRNGAITGVIITFVVMGIICAVIFSKYYEQKVYSQKTVINLGNDGNEIAAKINLLLDLVDDYYLYDYDDDTVIENIYKAVMDSMGDPYTVYYTADEYKEITESSEGVYSGIGATVTKNTETGDITIVELGKDSPARESGMLAGDIIYSVDGTVVDGMDLDTVVSMMKGQENTKVQITVLRDNEKVNLDITRRQINYETVDYKMLDGNTGYIQISQFDAVTTDQFKEALDDLKKQGMEKIIFDVRNNPGGRLDAVTDILDELLPEGLLVYTVDKYGNREEISSDADAELDIPAVVLVNENSASASEIFSGALQDYNAAKIIGTQTFGKGIVQSIIPLSDDSAVKITIEDYYTPNGNNIHGIGITPDMVVELDEDEYVNNGVDTQLNAALEYFNNK